MSSRGLAWMWAVLTTASSLGSGGCSLLFTDAPPPRHTELPYFDCSSGRWAPNLDVGFAAVWGLAALGAADDRASSGSERSSGVVGTLLLTGLFAGSAIAGYQRTASCREAKALLAERIARNERLRTTTPTGQPYTPFDPWQAEGPPPPPAFPSPAASPAGVSPEAAQGSGAPAPSPAPPAAPPRVGP